MQDTTGTTTQNVEGCACGAPRPEGEGLGHTWECMNGDTTGTAAQGTKAVEVACPNCNHWMSAHRLGKHEAMRGDCGWCGARCGRDTTGTADSDRTFPKSTRIMPVGDGWVLADSHGNYFPRHDVAAEPFFIFRTKARAENWLATHTREATR